jgi:hypothetical protein
VFEILNRVWLVSNFLLKHEVLLCSAVFSLGADLDCYSYHALCDY